MVVKFADAFLNIRLKYLLQLLLLMPFKWNFAFESIVLRLTINLGKQNVLLIHKYYIINNIYFRVKIYIFVDIGSSTEEIVLFTVFHHKLRSKEMFFIMYSKILNINDLSL